MTPLLAATACAAAAMLLQPVHPAPDAPAAAAQPQPPPAEELAKLYPKGRDFAKERHELIMSRQPKDALKAANRSKDRFSAMVHGCPQLLGVLEYAVEQSPALLSWREKLGDDEQRRTVRECACDALKGRYDATPVMGELHDIMARFRASALPDVMRSMTGGGPVLVPTDRARPLLVAPTPWMGACRAAARFNELRALVAAREGDSDSFVDALTGTFAIAEIAEREPTILGRLIAHAMRANALDVIAWASVTGRLTPEMRTRLAESMDATRDDFWSYAVQGERLASLDTVDFAFADMRKFVDATGSGDDFSSRLARAWIKSLMAPREECLWYLDRLFTLLDRAGGADPAAAESAARELAAASKRLGTGGADRERYPYAAIASPAWERFLKAEHDVRNRWTGVRTLLAIEAYREEHQRPPETLAALVPRYLAETPKDRMTFGRDELRYALIQANADPLHRMYLLYSVGADLQDDHGHCATDRFRALSGNTADKGLDFVFNWIETWPPLDQPQP